MLKEVISAYSLKSSLNLCKMYFDCLKQLARLSLPLYKFENDRMKIIYAGYSTLKRNYCVNLLLGKNYNLTRLGRKWFWHIGDHEKPDFYDIIISETCRFTYRYFSKIEGYILPEFVGMRINIDRPLCEIIRKDVSHFSGITKCIRKHNLEYEILTGRENFDTFIEKFYLPYIGRRHRENARIQDLHEVWKSAPAPSILAVKEDGIIVAEAVIRPCGECLFALYMGIINGNQAYLRHGVAGAIYYFCILEGQKLGLKYVDIGSTPPFLNDGLTKYKVGLGAEFMPDFSPGADYLWLGINKTSDAAKDIIRSFPFMYVDREKKLVRCGS